MQVLILQITDTATVPVTNFNVVESKMVSKAIAAFEKFYKPIVNRTLKRLKTILLNLLNLCLLFLKKYTFVKTLIKNN